MTSNGRSNGPRAALRAGQYCPILTFFKPDTEELDLDSLRKHVVRLAEAGLVGLVAMGSNGEAVHLSRFEKTTVIRTARAALDSAGFQSVALIAGCTEQSVRDTISLCKESHSGGASHALILPPCYYKSVITSETIYQYFINVADSSPIPIMMYNYPGAAAGTDMDSDLMARIAQHPNVAGAKLTCANTGKLTRLAAAMNAVSCKAENSGWMAFGGLADMTIQTLISGGSGTVSGAANVVPKLCVHVFELWKTGKHDEAMKMQVLLAQADWLISKQGVTTTKGALQTYFGYGGMPRQPLEELGAEDIKSIESRLAEAMKVENSL